MKNSERMRKYGFAWNQSMGWTARIKGRFVLVSEYGAVIPDRFDGDRRFAVDAEGRGVVALAVLAKAAARRLARKGKR